MIRPSEAGDEPGDARELRQSARDRARRHFGFGAYSAHHPFGSILPSTTLHESGGAHGTHLSHSWSPLGPRLPYNPFASSYKNIYKAPSIAFSALRVDPSRVNSCDKSQPYAQRAEMKPLDQRPGSTLGSAARTASQSAP